MIHGAAVRRPGAERAPAGATPRAAAPPPPRPPRPPARPAARHAHAGTARTRASAAARGPPSATLLVAKPDLTQPARQERRLRIAVADPDVSRGAGDLAQHLLAHRPPARELLDRQQVTVC